jgi:hypothetical protein
MATRRTPSGDQLSGLVRSAFGAGTRLRHVTRVRGASKKGVYRVTMDGGPATAIVYVWAPHEDYWSPASAGGTTAGRAGNDPFSHATGLDLFGAAHERLTGLGVRVPRLYLADASREHYPADAAVVEDVAGPSLEHIIETGPQRAPPIMQQLSEALRALHADKAGAFGKLLPVTSGQAAAGQSCAAVVLARALADLADAAVRVPQIAGVRDRMAGALHERAAGIGPRAEHSLIHGELGPDHVLTDGDGRPVLIDIEGLMYFDPEWEHVFLRLRFGEHYGYLREPGLDPGRLDLYRLALHLSLVAGPLRLLDGDFPDREPMLQIAAYNTRQACLDIGVTGA